MRGGTVQSGDSGIVLGGKRPEGGRLARTRPDHRDDPDGTDLRIEFIGGRVDTPAAVLPDLDVSYFLTDHLAVSGQAGAIRSRPVIRNSLVGDIAIGSIWNAVVSGVVRYHFLPNARFNPYLGVGASATTSIAVYPAKGIPAFTVKSQTSPLIQAGFDYHLTGNWFGNAMVKYVFVPPVSYEVAGVDVKADLNMLVVGAGIGYRF